PSPREVDPLRMSRSKRYQACSFLQGPRDRLPPCRPTPPFCGARGMVRQPKLVPRESEESKMSIRPVKRIAQSKPTTEGAGVRLRRAFGFGDPSELDPFLLFDDFRNERPEDYLAGFPWHPHRGIETITYVLAGTVNHGDSLGNRGSLGAGDVQWMTAGSGIMHQEMPKGDPTGRMHGFQ